MVLDTPAVACIFTLAAYEIRPAGLAVLQLAPAGVREHVPDTRAENVVMVVHDDVSVSGGCAGVLRHATAVANTPVAVCQRIGDALMTR